MAKTSKGNQKDFISTYLYIWGEQFPQWRVDLFEILDLILSFFPTDLIQEIMNYHSSFIKENKIAIRQRAYDRLTLRTHPGNWKLESAIWKCFLSSGFDWIQSQMHRSFFSVQTPEALPVPNCDLAPSYQQIMQKIKYETHFLEKMEYTLSQFYGEEQLFLFECKNLVSTQILSYYQAPVGHCYFPKVIVRIVYKK